jgi:pilus assembly protein FimV
VLPHIDVFQDNGYTKEEMKMVWETRKIMEDDDPGEPDGRAGAGVLRSFRGGAHRDPRQDHRRTGARHLLEQAPGVRADGRAPAWRLPDGGGGGGGQDAVFVGRIREDISHPLGLNLWVVSDNVRKGAALNSIQSQIASCTLGLGDITLSSSLDQPLSAEIRLRGVGDLSPAQIMVRLASGADFERAGVERLQFLSDMQFEVELGRNGDGVIRVRSQRPVREPYLEFVVDVRWPTGRVLREYTVLLDLPTYAPAPQPAAAMRQPAAPAQTSAARGSGGSGGYDSGDYRVSSGDTMWAIANRTRPSGVSVQRMMVAIQRENPDAFIRGNINLLKAGHVLRIPDAAQLQSLSDNEASSAVSAQTRDWRGDAHVATDAAGTAAAGVGAGADDAYLKIAGDAAGEGSTGGAEVPLAPSAAPPLDEQLTEVRENLSAAELANEELKARVAALEDQVNNYQRLVELNNEGLSAAQEAAAAPEPTAVAEPEPVAPAVAAPETPPVEPGLLERVLSSTIALVAAAAVVLAGLLAFLFRRRRTVEEFVPAPVRMPRRAEPEMAAVPVSASESPDLPTLSLEKAALAGAAVAAVATAAGVAVPEATEAPADPLAEAEVYRACGRDDSAIKVLQEALAEDPQNQAARLKLMEIFADQGEREAFVAEYGQLLDHGDDDALFSASQIVANVGRESWLGAAPPLAEEDAQAVQAVLQGVSPAAGESDDLLSTLELDSGPVDFSGDAELEFDLDSGLLETADDTAGESADDQDLDFDPGTIGDTELADLAADEFASFEADTLAGSGDSERSSGEAPGPLRDEGLADLEAELFAESADSLVAGADDDGVSFGEIDMSFDLDPDDLSGSGPLVDTSAGDEALFLGQDLSFDATESTDLAAEFELAQDAGSASGQLQAAETDGQELELASAGDGDDLDFLKDSDEIATKLELAEAYIDMGDMEGAREILEEVLAEGAQQQRDAATALLDRLASV